ncbi:hypothetical protein Tco_1258349, partial [Tanacetum coccineum]
KDIKVKKSKNEQKPTRNEETSTRERFEANIKSRIKTVVEKSQERTEGVVGLSQWLEKMELVFHISGCAVENQVKFAICTLLGAALTWWNGHVRTLGHDDAYAMTGELSRRSLRTNTVQKVKSRNLKLNCGILGSKETMLQPIRIVSKN